MNIEIPIDKELVTKVFEPTLVPISQALGGIIHWVFKKPIEYGVVRTLEIENLKIKTEQQLNLIPEEHRTADNLGLTLKAFEDSRYQLSEEILVKYFSKLIAGTLDNRQEVKPVFSSIISEMSVDDAQLLNYFFNRKHLFGNQISHSNPLFGDERYRLFSPKKYYGISSDYSDDLHRNPQDATDRLFEDLYTYEAANSLLFLESKGLVFKDSSQYSHALIYAIEADSLKNDVWLSEVINQFSNYEYNRITQQTTEVYSLTSLGQSLANLVCHKD